MCWKCLWFLLNIWIIPPSTFLPLPPPFPKCTLGTTLLCTVREGTVSLPTRAGRTGQTPNFSATEAQRHVTFSLVLCVKRLDPVDITNHGLWRCFSVKWFAKTKFQFRTEANFPWNNMSFPAQEAARLWVVHWFRIMSGFKQHCSVVQASSGAPNMTLNSLHKHGATKAGKDCWFWAVSRK